MHFTEHQPVVFSQIVVFCITLLHAAPATASEMPSDSALG